MENRFDHNSEEKTDWGAYVKPPSHFAQNAPKPETNAALCARVHELLPSLVENDGEVRPEMAAAVFAHLTVCGGCAREFDEMQRVVATLNSLPQPEMPMDFSGIILQRIEREMGGLYRNADSPPFLATSSELFEEAAARMNAETATKNVSGAFSTQSIQTANENVWRQITLMGAFFAVLLLFLTSVWGRATLGASLLTAKEWCVQILQATQDIPLLGWITTQSFGVLSQSARLLEDTYRHIGANAARGLFLDMTMVLALYFYQNGRNRRASRMHS